jgi:hypothetical protein
VKALLHSDGSVSFYQANNAGRYSYSVLRAAPEGAVTCSGTVASEDGDIALADIRPTSQHALDVVPLVYALTVDIDTGWVKRPTVALGSVQPFGASLSFRRGRIAAAYRARQEKRLSAKYGRRA